jgi:two-component system OmpR family response regulator
MGRVLVVDDDEYVGMLFREELEAEGHEVEVVRDARDLPERLERTELDVLVLDLGLGYCDGQELLRRLRQVVPDLPVVICSGYDLNPSEIRELSAAFVLKSFDLGPLKETIAALLRQRRH